MNRTLRGLFKAAVPTLLLYALTAPAKEVPDMVLAAQAGEFIGEVAMVCGVIATADFRQDLRGSPTFLNFDRPYPNQSFSAVVWGRHRDRFDIRLEDLDGYKACVFGKIESYRGKPQIALTRADQINAVPPKP